jgi:hypothetical protein
MNTKIYEFTTSAGKAVPLYFRVGAYPNANLLVRFTCADKKDYGAPFCEVTKNTDVRLPSCYAFIKDYSENQGMLDFLIAHNLVEIGAEELVCEFVGLPIFKFNRARLQALDSADCETYALALKKREKQQRKAAAKGLKIRDLLRRPLFGHGRRGIRTNRRRLPLVRRLF